VALGRRLPGVHVHLDVGEPLPSTRAEAIELTVGEIRNRRTDACPDRRRAFVNAGAGRNIAGKEVGIFGATSAHDARGVADENREQGRVLDLARALTDENDGQVARTARGDQGVDRLGHDRRVKYHGRLVNDDSQVVVSSGRAWPGLDEVGEKEPGEQTGPVDLQGAQAGGRAAAVDEHDATRCSQVRKLD